MKQLLWISLGGACGTAARYLLSNWAARALSAGFPYGTLLVNSIGSFLISIIMYLGLSTRHIAPELRVILTSGVMGGFTTYSSFNYETLTLIDQGAWPVALLNIGVTLASCLLCGLLGQVLVRALL